MIENSLIDFFQQVLRLKYLDKNDGICSTFIKLSERFAKTAVIWVMPKISKYDSVFVEPFIQQYIDLFTQKKIKNAS